MTLTPPITQSDVDDGTVFVLRNGSHATVTPSAQSKFPWVQKNLRCTVTNFGFVFLNGESDYDLISRIPKQGEKMESQVVVKQVPDASGVTPTELYGKVPPNTLFQCNGIIYRRLQGELSERVSSTVSPVFCEFRDDCVVFLRPDLRLDLALRIA